MTPCSMVDNSQGFNGRVCLHFQRIFCEVTPWKVGGRDGSVNQEIGIAINNHDNSNQLFLFTISCNLTQFWVIQIEYFVYFLRN